LYLLLLLPCLLCTVSRQLAACKAQNMLLQPRFYSSLLLLLLLLLTVSDVHASLCGSREAVDEPAVHSAKHGITARYRSSNLRSHNSGSIVCTQASA
jgi:hypothetical protein